jgi:hypothetical protein
MYGMQMEAGPQARIHYSVPDERSSKRTPGLGQERFRGGRKHFQHINNAFSGNCFSGSSSLMWPEEWWNIMRAVVKQRAKARHPGHAGRKYRICSEWTQELHGVQYNGGESGPGLHFALR